MSLDLAYTLLSIFSILFIGIIVYLNNPISATNILFSLMCFSTIFWAIANYFSLHTEGIDALISIRFVLFFAAPHALLFWAFVHNFPQQKFVIKKNGIEIK